MQRGYPKKFNYDHPASYFRYLNSIKNPLNYNSSKANNNNNLIKYTSNNDIVKNPSVTRDKKLVYPKNHETTITAKKNPIFNIRNTVINFNMYDTGLFINPFNKKTHDRKKFNLINPYSTQSLVHPTKKYSKETSELYSQKTYNTSISKVANCHYRPLFKTKTISSTHNNNHSISINSNNTNNNNMINSSINSNINNKDILYSQSRPLKTQSILEDNKKNSLTSFNQLVNKMKNKQLYNKRHSNSVERNNNLFKSIKLNEYYLKNMKTKNEKKTTLELNTGGISNMLNNKYKSINANKNYTLPSLIVNSKKFFNPKKKNGILMQSQGKTMRIINPLQLNNANDNQKHYYLKGNIKI